MRKAHTEQNRLAYDVADSMQDAVVSYKRCRTSQYFILDDNSPDLLTLTCAYCKKPMTKEGGNRAIYSAKHKRAVIFHYDCSWTALFEDIFRER